MWIQSSSEAGVWDLDSGINCRDKVIEIREVNGIVQGENVEGKRERKDTVYGEFAIWHMGGGHAADLVDGE